MRGGRGPALAGLVCVALGWTAGAAALELTEREAAGKKIFLEGKSASGGNISARIGPAGTPMPGSVVPCANCHGADGRGLREGGVRPPDITWRRLTAPYGQRLESGREHPAYDESALARAVSQGVDPAGNRLDQAMPRFVMSMRDMADLTAYLKRIEDDRDPGLHPERLRIGTLLPTTGPLAELGETVAAVLRGVFDGLNAGGGIHGRTIELVVADPGADRASAEAALRKLVGEDDVFALIAPLVPALEGGFGEVADAARVPVIGPLARLSDGAGSRFLFDPLPGLREQLLALAEFAVSGLELSDPPFAIVHPDDEQGRALAEAIAGRLQRRGWSRAQALAYAPAGFDAEGVVRELAGSGSQAVFFVGRNDDFGALAAKAHESMITPYLFASSTQVGSAALQVAPMFAGRVFIAYPTLPKDLTPEGIAALEAVRPRNEAGRRHLAFQVAAHTAAQVLAEGLKRAGRDASREKLVTALENLHGFRTGLTPEIGFGPGQRVGAAGAHIVAVDLQKRTFSPTGRYIRLDVAPQ